MTLDVPTFAAHYRLEELPLGAARAVISPRCVVLGDLHGKSAADLLRVHRVGPASLQVLAAIVSGLALAGPPAPAGLLDLLDVGLDRLPADRREVLILRFGGAGGPPLTLPAIASRYGRSKAWMYQVSERSLSKLRVLAGPEFGLMLRNVERRVLAGTELRLELARVGRLSSLRARRRPWSYLPFYERLLVRLGSRLPRSRYGS